MSRRWIGLCLLFGDKGMENSSIILRFVAYENTMFVLSFPT